MKVCTVFSGVVVAALMLAFVPLGCGGVQEERAGVSRPLEIGAVQSSKQGDQRDEVEPPEATRQKLKGCINLRAGQWSERSYAVQLDAKANDRREMIDVKIRSTTMHDDKVVECLRQAIAAMTVPEHALHPRAVRPFSGGERMTREQRGPMGSESQNPFAWAFLLVVEEIGVTVTLDVIVQVGVGIIAAVGTLVMPKKVPPKDECLDKYVACIDSPLGSLQVNKWGETVCETCRNICKDKNGGQWPSGLKLTHRWQTCG